MNSFGYSCIPENKIITSFKRFIEEKKKNSFPSLQSQQAPSFVEHTPTQETITYQAQVISCYYSLDDELQNQFWEAMESEESIQQELSLLQGDDFYIKILQEVTKFFGIQRDSPNLKYFLENRIIYAYNPCGHRIYVDKIINFDEEKRIFLGIITKDSPVLCRDTEEEKWIVKWNVTPNAGEEYTMDEMDRWEMIESVGANVPKIIKGFMILDFSVVVMEKLYPLEVQDYNQKLVMSTVSFIEKLLPIGVHNNIKPSNIMKRIGSKGEINYLVADIGSMTIQPLLYGFKRFHWSPYWSSQVVDLETVTTVKNDLLELGYVLTLLSKIDSVNDEQELLELIQNIKLVEKPKEIFDWMNRVRMINEQDIQMKDFIDLKKLSLNFPKYNELIQNLCDRN
jgi:hypothetical protein